MAHMLIMHHYKNYIAFVAYGMLFAAFLYSKVLEWLNVLVNFEVEVLWVRGITLV